MRVAVTSTVIFDVPDADLEEVRFRLYYAHQLAAGTPMETLTGQTYTLVRVERLEVERA